MAEPHDEFDSQLAQFQDFMQHGDDFYKIELWRLAKAWYKLALDLDIEAEKVRRKIAACDQSLAYERKVLWILFAIALFITSLILLF
jgi:hypothetical protein